MRLQSPRRGRCHQQSQEESVSLGLIVTELVINALKHAFPLQPAGKGRRGLSDRTSGLDLVGRRRRDRPAGAGSRPKVGLGTSVVEALARQLGAHVVMSDARPGARIAIVEGDAPTLQ